MGLPPLRTPAPSISSILRHKGTLRTRAGRADSQPHPGRRPAWGSWAAGTASPSPSRSPSWRPRRGRRVPWGGAGGPAAPRLHHLGAMAPSGTSGQCREPACSTAAASRPRDPPAVFSEHPHSHQPRGCKLTFTGLYSAWRWVPGTQTQDSSNPHSTLLTWMALSSFYGQVKEIK